MSNKYTVEQFRADLEQPYAWPGGYPRYFITSDGAALSYKAAKQEQCLIEAAILSNQSHSEAQCHDGWYVVACDINWEDNELTCDHTGERIESAYGADND